MILTYAEYVGMDGDLSEQEFIQLERAAECEIAYFTHGRLSDTSNICDKIKALIFKLLPLLKSKAEMNMQGAASEVSNDGVSVKYKDTADDVHDEIFMCITKALQFEKTDGGIPLLYCGVDE